jgi:hypothetical protein
VPISLKARKRLFQNQLFKGKQKLNENRLPPRMT